ncbi:MAG TPA: hypothetical protein VGJ84_21080 [Polyangiaceae bacterium]
MFRPGNKWQERRPTEQLPLRAREAEAGQREVAVAAERRRDGPPEEEAAAVVAREASRPCVDQVEAEAAVRDPVAASRPILKWAAASLRSLRWAKVLRRIRDVAVEGARATETRAEADDVEAAQERGHVEPSEARVELLEEEEAEEPRPVPRRTVAAWTLLRWTAGPRSRAAAHIVSLHR